MTRIFLATLGLISAVFLASCGAVPDEALTPDVAGLTQEIQDLDASVSAEEAARVAQISYSYSMQLRAEYNVTDPALVHNAKVNRGSRPRGLCWHWADDLETRLRQESLQTLTLHRAIANHDNIRIEHSTVILSAKGQPISEGIVLDPWRYGGHLYWAPIEQDVRYNWEERSKVFAYKEAKKM
ncbi:hypothetical protein NBRC116594_06530 [Shimia sp. NS0008-38b]|uniref:hypothetical protein n=1 Tax=Shimia sp. NS0008-38b TaxID=3127653 RepID=UPI0031053DCF